MLWPVFIRPPRAASVVLASCAPDWRANLVIFARHIAVFLILLSIRHCRSFLLPIIRCVTCRRSGRRRLCLDGAAAAQLHPGHQRVAERRRWALVGVVTGARKTLIATSCACFFLIFLRGHEAITTSSPITGQVALRGESGCSPRKALPGKRNIVLRRLLLHLRAAGRCCCVSIIAGQGVTHKLARHMSFALFSLGFDDHLRFCARLLRRAAAPGCCAERAAPSVLEVRALHTCWQDTS